VQCDKLLSDCDAYGWGTINKQFVAAGVVHMINAFMWVDKCCTLRLFGVALYHFLSFP
jgi:hypothetical protein